MAFEIPKAFLTADDANTARPEAMSVLERRDDLSSGDLSHDGLPADVALLTAFKNGDQDAFAALYRRHARDVFQFAFYMAGDAARADELTQDVFVWLIQHAEAFNAARGSLPAFLGGVARKLLQRRRRAESRWSPLEDALDALRAISVSRAADFGSGSILDGAQLRRAITLLPSRYREVIVLCDLQENEYGEAAHLLGCSVGTVRSRLHRGRKLLARKLKPTGSDEAKRKGDGDAV